MIEEQIKLARIAVFKLKTKKYAVDANFNDHARPPPIDNIIPDIVGYTPYEKIIMMVFTENLNEDETRNKTKAFSKCVANQKFIIITQQKNYSSLVKKLKEWDIYVDAIWISKL